MGRCVESTKYSHCNVSGYKFFFATRISIESYLSNRYCHVGAAKIRPFAFGHGRATINGPQKQYYRTGIRERSAMSHGRGTANSWHRPASMLPQPFGTKNPVNLNAMQRWKATKMK